MLFTHPQVARVIATVDAHVFIGTADANTSNMLIKALDSIYLSVGKGCHVSVIAASGMGVGTAHVTIVDKVN